jgi:hypothetical protein
VRRYRDQGANALHVTVHKHGGSLLYEAGIIQE